MIFQAYRCICNVYNRSNRLLPNGGFIPAAPIRSSFVEAFADVKEIRKFFSLKVGKDKRIVKSANHTPRVRIAPAIYAAHKLDLIGSRQGIIERDLNSRENFA